MAPAAGAMDRRITFQSFTEAQDAYGTPLKTWANLSSNPTVWAEVTPLALSRASGGSEAFGSQQVIGEAEVRFRVRYRSDLNVEMRIVYGGENYDIKSISEVGRREGLEIMGLRVAA